VETDHSVRVCVSCLSVIAADNNAITVTVAAAAAPAAFNSLLSVCSPLSCVEQCYGMR